MKKNCGDDDRANMVATMNIGGDDGVGCTWGGDWDEVTKGVCVPKYEEET